MPELPEVQTFINHLATKVLNHQIVSVEVTMDKILKNVNPDQFEKALMNQSFKKLSRIGKYLVFHLDNAKIMLLHLRMEGKPYYQHKNETYDPKHVLFRIGFDNDYELRYHDTRRFGTVHIFNEADYLNSREIAKIALDPLDPNFSFEYVKNNLLKSKNKPVKTTILDQTKIAGIGNIYADEILFASKIHPETLIKNLEDQDFQKIFENATLILKDAIKHHGTTILSFKYKHGETGSFQNKLKVHTKKDFPCEKCQTVIQKIKVNGRGTYFCNKCQTLK